MSDINQLIDELAENGRAVRSYSTARGRWLLAAVATATLAIVFMLFGFRADVLAMSPWPMLSIAAGLMLMLAAAAGFGALRMARPQVGAASSPAPWLLAALLLLPVVAFLQLAGEPTLLPGLSADTGMRCLVFGLMAGTGTAVLLALLLRRGAPVAPERASWLVGLAAGAVGSLAVSLECPLDAMLHLGVWHVAVVPLSAIAARIALPPLLRW